MISEVLLAASIVCSNGPYIGNGVTMEIKDKDAATAELKIFDTEFWRGRPFKLQNKRVLTFTAQADASGNTLYTNEDETLQFAVNANRESGSVVKANFAVFEKGDLKCHPGTLE